MATAKHVPMRTCIATGNKLPKKELVRLVRVDDSDQVSVVIDGTGKLRGRGANLTPTVEAFDLAIKKKAIERALKLEHPLASAQADQLRSQLQEVLAEREFRQGRKPVTLKISKQELDQKLNS